MPICRWWLNDLLKIAERLAEGETAYAIAKSLCESLASVVHLKRWIAKAGVVASVLAREMGLMDAEPPLSTATRPGDGLAWSSRFSRWPIFTHAFSRAFYPTRFPLRSSHMILTG